MDHQNWLDERCEEESARKLHAAGESLPLRTRRTAGGNMPEDEVEREYQAAIERLLTQASACCDEGLSTARPAPAAVLPEEAEPPLQPGESEPDQTPELQELDLQPTRPTKTAATQRVRAKRAEPPETRNQLAVLRDVANTAAANSVNVYLQARRRSARLGLLLAVLLCLGTLTLMPHLGNSVSGGTYLGLTVLVLGFPVLIRNALEVRRLRNKGLRQENAPPASHLE